MKTLPRKILLATDGSSSSDPELRAAADLSVRTGAPVRVVHVGKDMPPPSHYGGYYNVFANDLKADRRAVGLAREQAAMIESLGGTIAEIYSSPGERPGEEIVKNTRHEDVGLVVIGERGLGRFRYATRTSIAATVVRDSYCPVLVVRGTCPGSTAGGSTRRGSRAGSCSRPTDHRTPPRPPGRRWRSAGASVPRSTSSTSGGQAHRAWE
jgi:nucleotide-binding universal stress UspA family protein